MLGFEAGEQTARGEATEQPLQGRSSRPEQLRREEESVKGPCGRVKALAPTSRVRYGRLRNIGFKLQEPSSATLLIS